jgi:Na+/H+-dicarboxylate symporter
MSRRLTFLIVVGMVLGLVVGAICHAELTAPGAAEAAAKGLGLVTTVFLRLVRMIIAPLVLATLIPGIAQMGAAAAIGRVGIKTVGWFLGASLVSLLIGLWMASLLTPGAGLHLPIPPADATSGVAHAISLEDFLIKVFPNSVADAMARNEILQIVVFSIFAGIALGALRERSATLLAVLEQVGAMMLKVTGYVMLLAPLAVFAAIAATVTTHGLGIVKTYGAFVGSFYLSLLILWAALIAAALLVVGRPFGTLLRSLREPLLLAFSTATSEAAYPLTLERLESFGISKRVAGFVLPLGYSFNLDGSMMYCTFATLFLAQAYGIELSIGQRITMVAILLVTSKGIAGVPRASLVVIAATLAYMRIPEAGLLLILGVDQFLDMGRSATNVLGNSVAAAVVAHSEGELTLPVPDLRPA